MTKPDAPKYTVQINVHCHAQARKVAKHKLIQNYTFDDYSSTDDEQDHFDKMLDPMTAPEYIMFLDSEYTQNEVRELQLHISQGLYDIALTFPGCLIVLKPTITASIIQMPDIPLKEQDDAKEPD